jgi:hypothetical protein
MPTDRARHHDGQVREEGAPPAAGPAVPAAPAEALVWPPPEHEIDDLQVIELEPFSTLPADAPMPQGAAGATAATAPPPPVPPPAPRAAAPAPRGVAPAAAASLLPDLSTHEADDDAFDRLRPDPVRRGPDGGASPAAVSPAVPAQRPVLHLDAGPPAQRRVEAPAPATPVPVAPAARSPVPAAPIAAAARPREDGRATVRRRAVFAAGLVAAFAAGWGLAPRAGAPPEVAPQTDAFLQVQSTPPGARVLLDGALLGEAPVRARIAPGRHVLEVRGAAASRRVEIEARAGVELAWSVEVGAAPPPR